MKNNIVNELKTQSEVARARRRLLESTKLSHPNRLPKTTFTVAADVCITCGRKFDIDDSFQQSLKVCRACLNHYSEVDAIINVNAKQKPRALRRARLTRGVK